MAKKAGSSARIWLNQYKLAGYLNAVKMSVKQTNADVTCLSDAGPRRLAENYEHTHEYGGFLDPTDDLYDEINFALLDDTAIYLGELFTGEVEGDPCYESIAVVGEEPRTVKIGAAQLLDLSTEGSDVMSRSTILRAATVTGTENGTGRNMGATTAGQIFQVVFRVFSGTFSSITMKIQESQNDGSPDAYADIAGLTSGAITVPGVVRVTTTAATEAWKRCVVSAWSGTNAVVGVTAGYVQGT